MPAHTPHPQRVNLTWSVGTGQTRFAQMRISHIKALALFAALLLLWTVVSLYFIHSMVNQSSQLQGTLQSSLATLLDYQSRYDSVYETAYNTTPAISTAPESTTVAKTSPAPQPLNIRKLLPEPQLISSGLKDWPLRVKRPLFTATGKEFVLQVKLQNSRKGKTVRGQIQAQAKLAYRDGTELKLSTNNTNSFSKYRIKNHKTQTFSFVLPPASAGHIEHISIVMRDHNNKQATWLLPVDLPYATPARLTISKN